VKPTITPTDITAQNRGSRGSIARMSRPIISRAIGREHAGGHHVHRQPFGDERAADGAGVRPPEHVLHEQRLEDEQAEGEPAAYSTMKSIHIGKPSSPVIAGRRDDAARVAGDAVHRRADALLPERPDELLCVPGEGSLSPARRALRQRGPCRA